MKKILIIALTAVLAGCGSAAAAQQPPQPPAGQSETPVSDMKESSVETGDIVKLGTYQNQDIDWYVLDIEEDKALLLSVHALDARPFSDTPASWDSSSLRAWLNDDFFNQAFSKEEQQKILSSTLDNGDDLGYGTKTGAATQDHVFLLSASEAEQYLSSDETVTEPTDYALQQGAYTNSEGNCAWWLRSPGMTDNGPAYYVPRVISVPALTRDPKTSSAYGLRYGSALTLYRNNEELR